MRKYIATSNPSARSHSIETTSIILEYLVHTMKTSPPRETAQTKFVFPQIDASPIPQPPAGIDPRKGGFPIKHDPKRELQPYPDQNQYDMIILTGAPRGISCRPKIR